jgi:hypothetical protein
MARMTDKEKNEVYREVLSEIEANDPLQVLYDFDPNDATWFLVVREGEGNCVFLTVPWDKVGGKANYAWLERLFALFNQDEGADVDLNHIPLERLSPDGYNPDAAVMFVGWTEPRARFVRDLLDLPTDYPVISSKNWV